MWMDVDKEKETHKCNGLVRPRSEQKLRIENDIEKWACNKAAAKQKKHSNNKTNNILMCNFQCENFISTAIKIVPEIFAMRM